MIVQYILSAFLSEISFLHMRTAFIVVYSMQGPCPLWLDMAKPTGNKVISQSSCSGQ